MDAERQTRALARGRAYDLLASLFREGPLRMEHLRSVEALAAFVPECVDEAVEARFHRLFRIEILPYESVFLAPQRVLGGERTAALWDSMRSAGFTPDAEPDHLSTQLAFLTWLCGAEADAWRDGLTDQALAVDGLARDFLRQHLGAWLPPFVIALQELDTGLYGAAAGLLLQLTSTHMEGQPKDELPPAEELLAQPKTGLREIAEWLATPARSGVWLSSAKITATARGRDLPRGFGKRAAMIENLLHTAVRHDALPELVRDIDSGLNLRQERLKTLPGGAVWAARVGHTRSQLEALTQAS